MAEKQPEPVQPEPEKCYACPFCEYTAKLPSLLSRHVNHHHKNITKLTGESRPSTAGDLLGVLKDKETVGDMLIATSEWLAKLTSPMDGKLSNEAVEWLKKHDAKTQFALRIIAFVKIKRALDLDSNLKTLDELLVTKLKDEAWRKKATPSEVANMIERIQDQQQKELEFIKEVSQLSTVDMKDIAAVLSQAFSGIKVETNNSTIVIPGMPQSPEDREQLRQILVSCSDMFTGDK